MEYNIKRYTELLARVIYWHNKAMKEVREGKPGFLNESVALQWAHEAELIFVELKYSDGAADIEWQVIYDNACVMAQERFLKEQKEQQNNTTKEVKND